MNRYFLKSGNGAILKFSNLPPKEDKEYHKLVDRKTIENGCEEITFFQYFLRFLEIKIKCFGNQFKR